MKSRFLILASLLLTFALAEEKPAGGGVTETKKIEGLIACTINSSAPPLSKDMATTKPTVTVDGKPVDKSNDIWWSATDKQKILRIGGWGDSYDVYVQWKPEEEVKSGKYFLVFSLKSEGTSKPPEKVEIRLVTSGDNNPIRKGTWDPAKLHWSLAPSSEHFVTIPYKEGENVVDITAAMEIWTKDPDKNFGFVIHSTTNQNVLAVLSDFKLRHE